MTTLVPIVMFGWIPAVLLMFLVLKPRIAVVVAFLAAWLFLPVVQYEIQGLPNYSKMSATSLGVLLATILFDPSRLLAFRPKLIDLPMFLWCTIPFASSILNGLSAYDGVSSIVQHTTMWGLPYFLGRVYFSDLAGLRILMMGIIVGGLIYVPLSLYEVRMSPQLHNIFYGHHQHDFMQTIRGDGWRPMVFMQHGLMLSMWMASASLLAIWAWCAHAYKELKWIPMSLAGITLLVTTILCKSTGAVALLVLGIGLLFSIRSLRTTAPVIVLALAPLGYMGARVSGLWSGQQLVAAASMVSPERASSLQFRLDNETQLATKAMQRPLLGWGGWGRSRVFDEEGNDISTTDGMWMIALGDYGILGLAAFSAIFAFPTLLLTKRAPARAWTQGAFAPAAALAVLLSLYMIDNLFNAMVNPIFLVVAGGVGGYAVALKDAQAQRLSRPRTRPMPTAQESKGVAA